MNEVETEAIRLTAMLLSTERWASQYSKAPEEHAKLLKESARFQLSLIRYFKNLAKKSTDFINWDQYNFQVAKHRLDKLDYNVDVLVNDSQLDENDTTFIKLNLQPVQNMIVTGAQAGATTYGMPLAESTTSATYQKIALKKVAAMVGKKVTPDGQIIDNPNPEYNILDTVRKDIEQSITVSLGLGETIDEATARMEDVIADPDRAELIAQTETVNSYNIGVMQYGSDTNAVGKEWESSNTEDICAENESEGPIPYEDEFPSGDTEPAAHPRCMCAIRLIYQEEWDRLGLD
jgi:hypothetical protein